LGDFLTIKLGGVPRTGGSRQEKYTSAGYALHDRV